MARRTKAEAEATREAILESAEWLFLEQGVGATSLADIAARAHVTRGAVYWHFANKADLFNAMMQPVRLPLDELSARLDAQADENPIEQLRFAINGVINRLSRDARYRHLFIIWLHRLESTCELAMAAGKEQDVERSRDVMLRIFERASTQGLLRAGVNPSAAALAMRSLLVGMYTEWLRDITQFDIVSEGGAAIELLLNSLVGPSNGSR